MDFAGAHSQRLPRDVHEFLHGDVQLAGGQLVWKDHSGDVLHEFLLLLAHGGTRHVNGHVSPADNDNLLANLEAIAKIDIQEKVDALHHAV